MKLQIAPVFGEYAVLQRNKKIPVWGKSADGDTVHIKLGEEEQTVRHHYTQSLPAVELERADAGI